MKTIVEEKFKEWTKKRDPLEKSISIFEHIREIPFVVDPGCYSLNKGQERMLRTNKGFCIPKHYLLGAMFWKLGVSVRYCVYFFEWKNIKASFPVSVKRLVNGLPIAYHLACKIFINRKWLLVDATWPLVLKKKGFCVNEAWDGRSAMINAVEGVDEIIFKNPADADDFLRNKMAEYTLPEKLELSRFSLELNVWMEKIFKRHSGHTLR
ncbi:MAG: hypothetical protein ABH869_06920 [Candidatus Omnitrophota bacterium]